MKATENIRITWTNTFFFACGIFRRFYSRADVFSVDTGKTDLTPKKHLANEKVLINGHFNLNCTYK